VFQYKMIEQNSVDSAIVQGVFDWSHCLSILKPGAFLLALSSNKTHHRMTCAIEDAGFEIRDMIAWLHSGEMTPITIARKPLSEKTIVENVLKWGTGGLNIDGCRIGIEIVETHSKGRTEAYSKRPTEKTVAESGRRTPQNRIEFVGNPRTGRFPANFIHDGSEEVIKLFPETTSGSLKKGTPYNHTNCNTMGNATGCYTKDFNSNSGSAARFFYRADDLLSLFSYLCKLVAPFGGSIFNPLKDNVLSTAIQQEGFNEVIDTGS